MKYKLVGVYIYLYLHCVYMCSHICSRRPTKKIVKIYAGVNESFYRITSFSLCVCLRISVNSVRAADEMSREKFLCSQAVHKIVIRDNSYMVMKAMNAVNEMFWRYDVTRKLARSQVVLMCCTCKRVVYLLIFASTRLSECEKQWSNRTSVRKRDVNAWGLGILALLISLNFWEEERHYKSDMN